MSTLSKEIYFVKFDLLENKIVYLYNQEEQSRTKIDFYVKGVIHMLKKERQERIITLLEKDFYLTNSEIANKLGVSEMTIRRDVTELAKKNKEEAFLIAAQRLEKMGYVNENYLNGLIAREREFPTGLITKYLNIALPHSECEYVEKPFVFVMQLKNPIYFYQMGDSQKMTVENLFFLGIKEPKEQVGLLQAFMNLFMDETFVENYKKQETPQNIYELITNYI